MNGDNKRLVGEVASPDCSSVAMAALPVCPLRAGEAQAYLARPHDQRAGRWGWVGAQTAEGLTACTTNGPVTPPATGQHRPRKRGRRQAGLRRTWERGVAREIAVAPRRRALALSLGVAGGGDEAQTSGATVVRLQKVYQARSYGFVPRLLFTSWSRSSLQSYFWAKVNKTNVAPCPPLVLGLGRRLGGARRHEALIRQNRAHGQIHCHVSAMSASSVHVIGGASQISWPA